MATSVTAEEIIKSLTSTILAPDLMMVSLTVRLDHWATVKCMTSSSGHSSPSSYLSSGPMKVR